MSHRLRGRAALAPALLVSTVLAPVVLAPAAQAQILAEDEIIVTATKRASTLQEVPFSVNALTQEDIQRTGATNLEDVSRNVAGLSIQNLGPGQSQVAVRGVSAGQIVRDQPGVKEQVGVYLDESVISLSLFTPDLDLFDLDRVETLRGPQGTLFGSGSVGGTIRYITNQPDPTRDAALLEASVNTVTDGGVGGHVKGMVNVPLSETAALRAVGYHTEYAGFIDALNDGNLDPDGVVEDINDGKRTGGRVSLRFETEAADFALTPRLIYQKIETDGFNRQEVFNLFANPFTTTRPAVQLDEREQFLRLQEAFEDELFIADLTAEWEVGAFALDSVTSYTDRDILVSRDASALTGSVSVDLGFDAADVLLPSRLDDTTKVEQITQEFRVSNADAGLFEDRLDWLLGVFYAKTERDYAQRLPTPGFDAATDAVLGAGTSAAVANGFGADSPFNSDLPYDLEQTAVFGEATFAVTDRLDATAGVRYYDYDETRDITTGGLFASGGPTQTDETSSDGWTPRFILDYAVNDSLNVNAQASRGFRLGGVNDPLNVGLCEGQDLATFGDPAFQSFEDETLWNYEVGAKAQRPGLRFNAAVFYTDITDLQTTLDAGSCSSRLVFNVPDAHTAGVEAELVYEIGEQFEIAAAGSWIEAEFDSGILGADGNERDLQGIREGNRLPSVPELQLSGSATWSPRFETRNILAPYLTVSAQYVGSRFTQPSDQEPEAGIFVSNLPFAGATGLEATEVDLSLDSYVLVNASAGFDITDRVGVQLYVTNLLDENADLSFNRERGGRARLAFFTNTPRTVGLTTRLRY